MKSESWGLVVASCYLLVVCCQFVFDGVLKFIQFSQLTGQTDLFFMLNSAFIIPH
jgi:hypothetical protein